MNLKLLKEDGNALLQENGFFILLDLTQTLAASTGYFVLTGEPVQMSKNFKALITTTGYYILTGYTTTYTRLRVITAQVGKYILTGFDVGIQAPLHTAWNAVTVASKSWTAKIISSTSWNKKNTGQ